MKAKRRDGWGRPQCPHRGAMLAPSFKQKKGPAQAGPFEQDVSLALGHDRRGFSFAHTDAAGHANCHEGGNQRKQKLFHRNPLCCCPWLIDADCTTKPHGCSSLDFHGTIFA
jgi:hypothetical protein